MHELASDDLGFSGLGHIEPETELVRCVSNIVAAYLSKNQVSLEDLPGLIRTVRENLGAKSSGSVIATTKTRSRDKQAVGGTDSTASANASEVEMRQPAVPVNSSVKPGYICCLEDGKKFKTLRRHLNSEHGLSPDEYKERWGLPPNYPMVAAQYASRRSQLAKSIGLGRTSKKKKQKKNLAG